MKAFSEGNLEGIWRESGGNLTVRYCTWMKKRWMKAFSVTSRSSCLVKRYFLKRSFGRRSFMPRALARESVALRISPMAAEGQRRNLKGI